jgi:endonuclease YncB( thermonuclease family)
MSRTRAARRASIGALVTALAATILPAITMEVPANAAATAKVVRWVDGDTVVTSRGTVRLIGVDTPESGKCGSAAATALAQRIAPAGSVIRLVNPKRVKNRDAYSRLLRYVNHGKSDVGAIQIKYGAWARYDSRDGYQKHPRQSKYRRLDSRQRNYCGYKPTSAPKPKPATGGGVSGPVSPAGKSCPSYAPIKGNASSMIYHRPGQQYYAVTTPEECFRTAASAEAAGYRAAKI